MDTETLSTGGGPVEYVPLSRVGDEADIARLPYVVRVFLENVLRHQGRGADASHVEALVRWPHGGSIEIPFYPARVVLQDLTGVPCVADLAALRDAVDRLGGDPGRVNPSIRGDLVIDHSVIVDEFGMAEAFQRNVAYEVHRNRERFAFLRWAQGAFERFSVVPPGAGIVHQVNLEYFAQAVMTSDGVAHPDTLVGTDSHTTMIGGLGVLGWGVGGIEAEAALLGEALALLTPVVVGVRLTGRLPEGATATDLVLAITEMLRAHGVVGKFVEFFGDGLDHLTVPDRATISNMSPEYGATEGIFPIDAQTIAYMRASGRDEALLDLVERYCRTQGLYRETGAASAEYSEVLEFDLATVEPSLAGPRRPQDRVPLAGVAARFREELAALRSENVATIRRTTVKDGLEIADGSVVIAAITSCTNTSNPSVMIGAGLLARNAVERGLSVSPLVKTSLAPGSPVVMDYLERAGLVRPLEQLGFFLVGFGCTTCIAAGTPVLQADGTARPIEHLPVDGGAKVFGPAPDGGTAAAAQTRVIARGVRDCVALTLQDGRTLTCTPDHEILRADGRWIRADELRPGTDRVVVGLEAPVDEPLADEAGFALRAGTFSFTMERPAERARTLAFARLLGHLLDDGSISTLGRGRVHVGQALDREAVLADVEVVTGKRPAGTRYDERKWTIVLPTELTQAIAGLEGVRAGRRIHQPPALPAFILEESCPVAVVREFLAGRFGVDGTGPVLKRLGPRDESAILEHPQYSHRVKPGDVAAQRTVMRRIVGLLARCSVRTDGATIREYPVRRAASSYSPAQDGEPRIEVRLELPDGLSFVTNVGFRYSVDKSLRASAAAVYWRTIDTIHRQRVRMSTRINELHEQDPGRSFRVARELAAAELARRELILSAHYSTLVGFDRFSRLPNPEGRRFRPLHREGCGFPSPVEVLREIGARGWFAPLLPRESADFAKRYGVAKESLAAPTLALQVLERRDAGEHDVFDLSVADLHAFVAGGVAVHNCIGNSGDLPAEVAAAIDAEDLTCAAVLSGNRNFEARIHPQVRFSFLASPPLVVAYALAGRVDFDPVTDPVGYDRDGNAVLLRDIWPPSDEIARTVEAAMNPAAYRDRYAHIYDGNDAWNSLSVPTDARYSWDPSSTYIKEPPFVQSMTLDPAPVRDITGARVLGLFGDSITTDHISPAGRIAPASPAGRWLVERGVEPKDFNTYGSRRGHDEVMVRGTFANIRLRNLLVAPREGGYTIHQPSGEQTTIFEASQLYRAEDVPLLVIAGAEYGSGSSRDWAAKGTALLGVRAVIAVGYERIHRSNLIQMGVLPLQFLPGDSASSLGVTGHEVFEIRGIDALVPGARLVVSGGREDGPRLSFEAIARIDTPTELRYYREGGILPAVVRELVRG